MKNILGIFFLSLLHQVSAQEYFNISDDNFQISFNEPLEVIEIGDGHYFIDFGKAYFGTLEITSKIPQQDSLILHFGEKLIEDRRLDRKPGGTIRYQRIKINQLNANENVLVQLNLDKKHKNSTAIDLPKSFGVIMPFRYVEIENLKIPIEDLKIKQKIFHYRFNDEASHFESSNQLLDSIWNLCKHTIKATSFTGFYIDGDRERLPYEADAYINQLSHYSVDSVYDISRRTNLYFLEHPTWPTEWLLHTVPLFYQDYMYTGDRSALEDNYDALKLKTLVSLERKDGLISAGSKKMTAELIQDLGFKKKNAKIKDIVDWPPGQQDTGWKLKNENGERDGYEMLPINTVVNSFYYYNLVLMTKIAAVLNKKGEVKFWKKKSKKLKKTINEKLFNKSTGIYIDGEGSSHSALHANMFPLAFDLVPKEHEETVINFIKNRGMACSVYGSQYLLEGLFKYDQDDYALQLITDKNSDRSWSNMINIGATMTLEAWDPAYKPNLDWNHAWGTAPANIITRYLWGVQPKSPGFKVATIHPRMADLTHSKIKVPSQHGIIKGTYKIVGKQQIFEITLPEHMKAEFILPDTITQLKFNGKLSDALNQKKLHLNAGKNILIIN